MLLYAHATPGFDYDFLAYNAAGEVWDPAAGGAGGFVPFAWDDLSDYRLVPNGGGDTFLCQGPAGTHRYELRERGAVAAGDPAATAAANPVVWLDYVRPLAERLDVAVSTRSSHSAEGGVAGGAFVVVRRTLESSDPILFQSDATGQSLAASILNENNDPVNAGPVTEVGDRWYALAAGAERATTGSYRVTVTGGETPLEFGVRVVVSSFDPDDLLDEDVAGTSFRNRLALLDASVASRSSASRLEAAITEILNVRTKTDRLPPTPAASGDTMRLSGTGITEVTRAVAASVGRVVRGRRCLYVAPGGLDFYDGLSPETPKLTLAAAKMAATTGDLIVVLPGGYSGSDLLKPGVDWYFAPGAVVYASSVAALFRIAPGSGIEVARVGGRGSFLMPVDSDVPLIYLDSPSATLYLECEALVGADKVADHRSGRLVVDSRSVSGPGTGFAQSGGRALIRAAYATVAGALADQTGGRMHLDGELHESTGSQVLRSSGGQAFWGADVFTTGLAGQAVSVTGPLTEARIEGYGWSPAGSSFEADAPLYLQDANLEVAGEVAPTYHGFGPGVSESIAADVRALLAANPVPASNAPPPAPTVEEIETGLINDVVGPALRQAIVDKINQALPDLDDLSLAAIADATAGEVRNRLATELARIDAPVSSRLASGDFDDAFAAGVAGIRERTDRLPDAPAATGAAMSLTTAERGVLQGMLDGLGADLADPAGSLVANLRAAVELLNPDLGDLNLDDIALAAAAAVRAELAAELARIDADVSSRSDGSADRLHPEAIEAIHAKLLADPVPAANVTGFGEHALQIAVDDDEGEGLPGVRVTVKRNGKLHAFGTVAADGTITFAAPDGEVVVLVSLEGYLTQSRTVTVDGGDELVEVALVPVPPLADIDGHLCRVTYVDLQSGATIIAQVLSLPPDSDGLIFDARQVRVADENGRVVFDLPRRSQVEVGPAVGIPWRGIVPDAAEATLGSIAG